MTNKCAFAQAIAEHTWKRVQKQLTNDLFHQTFNKILGNGSLTLLFGIVNLSLNTPLMISKKVKETSPKKRNFEKEYAEIMKSFKSHNNFYYGSLNNEQTIDYFVKFSLYQESPDSIISTNTCMINESSNA